MGDPFSYVVSQLRIEEAKCDALRAELAEARRDAERYRWLRDHLHAQNGTGRYYLPIGWPADDDKRNAGDSMDAAIDAARGKP